MKSSPRVPSRLAPPWRVPALVLALLAGCEAAPAPKAKVGATPAATLGAEPSVNPSPPLPTDRALSVTRFDNGVTFASRVKPNEAGIVVLALVVHGGSLLEEEGERGLAHFVEHMAFNGTVHHPKDELRRFFDGLGLALGADVHATTTPTSTSYFLVLPGTDAALLDRGAAILKEWATSIVFDDDAVEQERGVLLSEMRLYDGVRERVRQVISPWLLGDARHAKRDPLGLAEVITAATSSQLERFYRRWYGPRSFTVVAHGQFDAQEMQRRVQETFGSIPREADAPALPRFELPVPSGEHALAHADPELGVSTASVYLQRALASYATEHDYRERLLSRLVAHVLNRRVQRSSLLTDAQLLGASATYVDGAFDRYGIVQLAATTEADPGRALSALLTELERLVRHGVSPREVELARKAVVNDWVVETNDRGLRPYAAWLAERLAHGFAVPSPEQQAALNVPLLAEITPSDVQASARLWAESASRHLLVLGREAAALPSEAALRQVSVEAKAAAVEPWPHADPKPLMVDRPAPGRLGSKRHIAEVDVQEWTLANGARVVFKRMPSDQHLAFVASSPGGYHRLEGDALMNARLTGLVLPQLGLGVHDAATTADLLSEARIGLEPRLDEYSEGARGGAPVSSLEQMFQALHLMFTAPRLEPADFELARRRLRAFLEQKRTDPTAVFGAAIERQVLGEHARHQPLLPDAVALLDPESVRAVHADRFGNIGDFTFVFVGETTEAALEPLIQRYLASLPGSPRADAARETELAFRPGVTRVRVQRGGADKAQVRLVFHGDGPLSPQAEQELEALRAYVDLHLHELLRERLGGVYGVDTSFVRRGSPLTGYEVRIQFECQPAQSEALTRATLEVLEALRRKGPEPRLLATLREQHARHAAHALTTSGYWLYALGEAYRHAEDPRAIPPR